MMTGDGRPTREYGLAAAAVALATLLGFAMSPYLALTNLVMVYLLAALLVAARGRRGPALFASALGVLCFDFFFVPPRYSFAVSDTRYVLTFLVMFIVAVIISQLTTRLRTQAEAARLGEMRTAAMHALSRELATARGQDAVLQATVRHLAQVFGGDILALVPSPEGGLRSGASSAGLRELCEKERSVAQWVFATGRPAGLGTQALPMSEALFAPLIAAQGPVGVLRLQPRLKPGPLDPEQALLLDAFAHQIGLALEADRQAERAKAAFLDAEKERLRSSLLSSVSHDLRTPLAAIIGSASSLLQGGGAPVGGKARELLENIQQEAERLARLVHNLIQATRLESGAVQLRKEPCSLEELVGSALERTEKLLAGRSIATRLPEDLPLVPLDGILVEQVFVNLLENAARHTPAGAGVEVSARAEEKRVLVEVADHGPGLPLDALERVFEKFYHARSAAAGAGLGLAICRAVVEAHGGRIWAENRPGGGAIFRLALPLGEADVRG